MHFLSRAEGVLKTGYPDIALLCAYNSMLQAGRAILFADGVKERSHTCVVSYLSETHVRDGRMPERLVNVLDMTRLARHKTQYGGRVDVPEAEAQMAIDDARVSC